MTGAQQPAEPGRPAAVTVFVTMVVAAGVLVVAWAALVASREGLAMPSHPALVVLFASCMLVAELQPVSWPRRDQDAGFVTVSLAYSAALLFLMPGYLGAVTIAAGSAIADTIRRVPPIKTAFNAAMLMVMGAVGVAVLRAGGAQDLESVTDPLALVVILCACSAMFVTNSLAINTVIALDTRQRIADVIRRDFWLSWETDGILLPLGPVLALVGVVSPFLLPFAMLMTLAVYRSARTAAQGERAASIDALTGLVNRRKFDEYAESALERAHRSGRSVVLMIMDLDGFKEINDTFGHHVGDAVLTEVAARLTATVPEDATVARLGGDEFAVLLPLATDEDARRTAADITAAFAEPITGPADEGPDHVSLAVRGSIGIGLSSATLRTVSEVARAADAAMYEAKRHGDPYRVAHPTMIDADSIHADLDGAIKGEGLYVVYQPVVDARTEAVLGFEALARWHDPRHGQVPPAQFIPVAEACSLIGPLTRRVLDEALGTLARMHHDGHRVGMSVNVSAKNLADPAFPSVVANLLDAHQVRSGLVTLEITETAVMQDPAVAAAGLSKLLSLGVHMALDDFGAGYSSLGTLRDLPVTDLKIDRSLVADLSSERGRIVLQTLTDLADAFGMSTTAEGVEDRRLLTILADLGCAAVQGFGIAHPMNHVEAVAWLNGRESAELSAVGRPASSLGSAERERDRHVDVGDAALGDGARLGALG